MMKAWKGRTDALGGLDACDYDGPPPFTPVLVIDASKFPEDAPEIGSEWVDDEGDHHTVASAPAYICGEWVTLTTRTDADGAKFPYHARIDSLKPIPEEPQAATDKVVGTLEVSRPDGRLVLSATAGIEDGVFDIIKRGDGR